MSAAPWYNPAWRYRCKITIPAAKVAGVATNFPVYVPGSVLPAAVYTGAQANGNDLLFTASDGTTKLAHERVHWVPASSGAELHFKAPSLTNLLANEFFLYWGNAAATDQAAPTAVWSNGYIGVWHLGEAHPGPGRRGAHYVNSATGVTDGLDGVAPGGKDGKLFAAGGETFDGSNDYVQLNGLSAAGGSYTFSCWVKSTMASTGRSLFAGGTPVLRCRWNMAGGTLGLLYGADGRTFGPPPNDGAWHRVTFLLDGANTVCRAYVDTTQSGTDQVYGATAIGGNCALGGIVGGEAWGGAMDEARLSSVVRSVPWITAEYANQSDPATFLLVGGAEQPSSPMHRLGAYGYYSRHRRQ